jgi:hypothetical protein
VCRSTSFSSAVLGSLGLLCVPSSPCRSLGGPSPSAGSPSRAVHLLLLADPAVLPSHADVADFEIGLAVALTSEHPLVSGGETSVVTNVIQRPQYMVVCVGPIRNMVEAGVDVVTGTFITHEIQLTGAWHVRRRSEGRVVGEPEQLMKEGNIVILRD